MPGYQVQQGAPARADMINRSEPGYRGWPASAGRDNSEWQRGVVQRGSTYVMWFPVDVEEYPLFYAFTADIPGVAKSDVKVQYCKRGLLL